MIFFRNRSMLLGFALLGNTISGQLFAGGADIERKPVEYSKRQGDNPVTRLKAKMESGEIKLTYQPKVGYLPSLLENLKVPVETQTLVFSKTSLQRNRIAPKTPRAIYFNDDIYVGFCKYGEVLEISVADRELGTEFYTLSQDREKPQLVRHTESCLVCHGASATHGLPGHLIRSVYTDEDGTPVLSLGSHRIDTSSDWNKRFGGWYVSGKHGEDSHLGNLILNERLSDRLSNLAPEKIDNSDGQNVIDLQRYFDTTQYLSPHSDIAAHLVLTHQAHIHNLIVKLNLETQFALHEERELNRELKDEGRRWESTRRRIRNHATELVEGIFFCEEATLPGKVEGSSKFAVEFSKQGPKDSRGRTLKSLALSNRLMTYPCSYLVYTDSFQSLPSEAKAEVYRQMKSVLRPKKSNEEIVAPSDAGAFSFPATPHLTEQDRIDIDAILKETLPGWKE